MTWQCAEGRPGIGKGGLIAIYTVDSGFLVTVDVRSIDQPAPTHYKFTRRFGKADQSAEAVVLGHVTAADCQS